jgi:hypothetical protein
MKPMHELFCREYVRDWNASRAYVAAGFSPNGAGQSAHTLLKSPEVADWIEKHKAQITAKIDLKVEDVVRAITEVITADPRELTETRIGACRYCHGLDHQYQRTPQEFRDHVAAWERRENTPGKATGQPLNIQGGDGYKRFVEPHPECPECEGQGIAHTIIKDTRKLSASAARLYAGVKQGKHGIEVLTQSKDKAIEQAAKYLGMNKEQVLVGNAPAGLTHFYPPQEDKASDE